MAALSKRQAHKETQNHKFEIRNEESFKRRQKTSRQKKLDHKLLPPKSTTRVSYLPSAKRLFIRDQQSTIPLFSPIRGSNSSFSSTSMFDVHLPPHLVEDAEKMRRISMSHPSRSTNSSALSSACSAPPRFDENTDPLPLNESALRGCIALPEERTFAEKGPCL